ncbi:unnamed protein product [Acanthoscelides obtectus]|uniref:Uncharacterized protein n=1 Tax=Acanthoscelides obtectus TaxID=200917 RepID=A0A9P0M2M6_ACAOB|nr:unnamed protein product [Acanthoscelides obtectus]CAK1651527.1 hypothetical protein AOBTE_LOCUS17333 [Acanthoscelides obtectus]
MLLENSVSNIQSGAGHYTRSMGHQATVFPTKKLFYENALYFYDFVVTKSLFLKMYVYCRIFSKLSKKRDLVFTQHYGFLEIH